MHYTHPLDVIHPNRTAALHPTAAHKINCTAGSSLLSLAELSFSAAAASPAVW